MEAKAMENHSEGTRVKEISLKRVYDEPAESDGYRVLVDRLWPRGISKAEADIDEWAKDLTPTADLRKWFHEDQAGRWDEFQARYRHELEETDAVAEFLSRAPEHVTLVYAGKDPIHNHALALRDVLLDASKKI